MALLPNPSNTAVAPVDPNARKKTGTGFTNLNRIMAASSGNRLGQAVGGGVAQQANQAKQGLVQARSEFNDESQAHRLDSDTNKDKVQQVLSRADAGQEIDDNAAKDFATFRAGQYAGPQTLNNEDQVINRAQNAQNLGGLSSSAGGRQALLQRFVGGAGYSQGKQQLDNLLLGQSGGQDLRDARRATQGLTQNALSTADAARQQGQYLANSADAFGKDVTGQINTRDTANIADVDRDVSTVSQNEALRSALYKQIQDKLAADGVRTSAGQSGDARSGDIGSVNEALALAQANNIAQQGDTDIVSKLYNNLMTPAELLYHQQIQSGGGGYLGYGDAAHARDTTKSGGNVYSNLGIGEVLNNAFTTKAAQNIDRGGVASDLERAKAAALAKLGGKTSVFTPQDAKYQASSAAFDMNKAGSEVDQEIARLKGESNVDLPTVYEDTPIAQKLARTFAPTLDQSAADVKQDAGDLFSQDKSLGDRATSALKLSNAPLRAANGMVLTQAQLSKALAENTLNDAFKGNAGGVAGELGTAPLTQASVFGNQAAGALKQLPIVGNLLSKPVALASSVTGKAATAAKTAAKSVARAIASLNPFCYGAGTPIKLKDGSFKAVEKIKLGDQLFYGGEVTATGRAKVKDMYEYLGTKVTGSHAVFENGQFVRVEDSKFGKKLPGNEPTEVFPIECKNHIVVTKTHLGSDFSEVDGGQTITPEKRLVKLNSDKARLKKLDMASAVIFKKNNEN